MSGLLTVLILLAADWETGYARSGLPTVYDTHLGARWGGPNTCIEGAHGSAVLQKRGDDPAQLWFDLKLSISDSSALRTLWSGAQQCVTNAPGVPDREGAFVAGLFDGKVIKMTYIFGGPGGKSRLNSWHDKMVQAHGPGTISAGARRWIVDSLEIVEGLPTPLWAGGVPVQVRSRSGCQAVRAEIARLKLVRAPPPCW